ncbi:hypothetical protein ASG84_25200 [Rhodococcus sp. Leaf278]|uniref:alpha/beta hydrolase n=1 Tax=Rhodococcus sp. Leaf278 TaxID=1736319 RepID=UPI00070EF56A|nr:alpha/beta hydrolase [Rhodococcus sp. Leaf278]KQU52350.1 hypothetical protein ASG84_25200 [Rhodococcus sp. Leaf278]
MPVDPFLAPLLSQLPPFPDHIDDFEELRATENAAGEVLVGQVAEPGPDVAVVREDSVPVEGGSIKVRIYEPFGDAPHPVHLYLHGGGWIAGTIESSAVDIVARERCVGAGCVVVTAEYRKAPEYPYPTGLDDAYATLTWIAEHSSELGVRPDAVTIGGGSAGANLAAAVALRARDENGPSIAFQLLEVPALDLTFGSASIAEYGQGYGLTEDALRRITSYYLPDPGVASDPYVSPLKAASLAGLPPAHIMSSEYDPVRDDGERYARRLVEDGVEASFSLQAGHIHISSAFTKVMESAREWRAEALATLTRVHDAVGSAVD